jgi:hypothetical protein
MRFRARTGVALASMTFTLAATAATVAPAAYAEVHSASPSLALRTSTPAPAAEEWIYAGKYYSYADCAASGQEEIAYGADQYRCVPEIDPDGSIAYWNLWVLYNVA